jgi:hypothetical protein
MRWRVASFVLLALAGCSAMTQASKIRCDQHLTPINASASASRPDAKAASEDAPNDQEKRHE